MTDVMSVILMFVIVMSVLVIFVLMRAKIPSAANAVVMIAVLAMAFAMLAGGGLSARAQPSEQPAAEMLQDGLDALSDSQSDLAAELFEQLVQSYPGTPESVRAERELAALGTEPRRARGTSELGSSSNSGFARRTPESEDALRFKFAKDAGDRVFFAENSAVIGGRARALIEAQARWLAQRSDLTVTVIGRADDGGPVDAAGELSKTRAEAVRDRLVSGGVAATRITIDARGARDPVATCRSSLCQAQNRHAETVISSSGGSTGAIGESERGGGQDGSVRGICRPCPRGRDWRRSYGRRDGRPLTTPPDRCLLIAGSLAAEPGHSVQWAG